MRQRDSQSCVEEDGHHDEDRRHEGEQDNPVCVNVPADAGRDGETEAKDVDNKSNEYQALKVGRNTRQITQQCICTHVHTHTCMAGSYVHTYVHMYAAGQ